MLTTLLPGSGLQSRPMTVIEFDGDGCFWFLCEHDPQEVNPSQRYQRVNVAISNEGKSTFVSINGSGEVLRDARLRHRLWSRMARPWFPDGPDSPNLAVLKVTPTRAEFWDAPDSRVVRALAMATSIVAGKPVGMGEHGVLHPQPPNRPNVV
jgi:general stress protein 26